MEFALVLPEQKDEANSVHLAVCSDEGRSPLDERRVPGNAGCVGEEHEFEFEWP